MIRLFFVACALIVTVTLVYHFFPGTAGVATTIPVNGMGINITWLAGIALLGGVIFWRASSKS